MNRNISIAVISLGTLLAGCTTMGTNVNGSFTCEAPDGVCAPSTVIDDGALARIEETTSGDLLNPAGPYMMDDGIDAPVNNIAGRTSPMVATNAPTYQLSVVFPSYTDATGASHARRTINTEASLPGRGDAMDAMALRGRQPTRNQGLLAAAESAPPYLAIAPEAVPPSSDLSVPAEALAAADAGPIAAIQAQVSDRLASRQSSPRRQAASFPGTVE